MESLMMMLLVAFGVVAVILIGTLPYFVAKSRGHANAAAVGVCGVVGIFTFGVFWLVALVWAFTGPGRAHADGSSARRLDRIQCPLCARRIKPSEIPYQSDTYRCPGCGALNSI